MCADRDARTDLAIFELEALHDVLRHALRRGRCGNEQVAVRARERPRKTGRVGLRERAERVRTHTNTHMCIRERM